MRYINLYRIFLFHTDYTISVFRYDLSSSLSAPLPAQRQGTGALVVSAFLDFLTYGLCAPYSETTDGAQFDSLLELVAGRGRALFKLFLVSYTQDYNDPGYMIR